MPHKETFVFNTKRQLYIIKRHLYLRKRQLCSYRQSEKKSGKSSWTEIFHAVALGASFSKYVQLCLSRRHYFLCGEVLKETKSLLKRYFAFKSPDLCLAKCFVRCIQDSRIQHFPTPCLGLWMYLGGISSSDRKFRLPLIYSKTAWLLQ